MYFEARRVAETATFERSVDNVIALTDASDLYRIPTNEQIKQINYNLDQGSLHFRKSGIRIHSVLHFVFIFRLFINNFTKQSTQLGGLTTRVSISLSELVNQKRKT